MKNYITSGETITVTLAATIASGAGLLTGALFGVAKCAGVSGDQVAIALEGVFELPKATGAVALGAKVYWDDTNKNITTTSSGNTLVGYCWEAVISGATLIKVKLINV